LKSCRVPAPFSSAPTACSAPTWCKARAFIRASKACPNRQNLEDPAIWYSGGLYHITVNNWSDRKAYHLTSKDGIHDWTFRGIAYDPARAFVRYTDGTVNRWPKLERPGIYLENGHVAAVTLAVIDVEKEQERGNDGHGSKVIVIPFDGAALDHDLQSSANPPKR
jgi:hypothetical protein